ncbi:hypothetical protein Hanom_Chr08g00693641 [Helianthus anomalus]
MGNLVKFEIWTKMATKTKLQGPGCKKFEIWTKVAKLAKPQGPKWQFTLYLKGFIPHPSRSIPFKPRLRGGPSPW